ncbi:MAG: hypothetical protein F7C07_01455 [Desulfurococcales archaeon]|nr:hypothetical protein [Desulfurococcales archaeon]
MSLICYWCGSERLAWLEEGYVVCQSCGTVISESSIEERVFKAQARHARRGARLGARGSRILKAGRVLRGILKYPKGASGATIGSWERLLLTRIANRKAESLLHSDERISLIAGLVDSDPVLRARSLRTRVALAVYLDLRSRGYSKRYSLDRATALTGSSRSSLEKTISKYRDRIEVLEKRIAG